MEKQDNIKEYEDRISLLELQIKHLRNDLILTRKESEEATTRYIEIYSDVEKKVAERTEDIKNLKRTLEQKSKELELMLDSSPGIIFFKDRDQQILRVNKNFLKMAGLPARDVIGKKYTELFTQENLSCLEMDNEVLQKGKPVLNRRETIHTSEGVKTVKIDRVPYKDIDNCVAGLIGFASDITEEEKAKDERTRLQNQLQYAQRMEAIGTLAGGIAHNFNNLLMGILGNADLVLMDTNPKDPRYQNLKTIEKLVKSGSELTKQLLNYARESDFRIKVWNLNHLIRETCSTFGVARKEINIHFNLTDNLPGVKVDRDQIEQVLLNLFINAADAITDNGDLYLTTREICHEDIKGKPYNPKPGRYVHLTIRDNGSGMDDKTMERIFEPFFTTKGLAKGTGLGLASVYGTVKAHLGYIDVQSEMGIGTTFNIYLPATAENAEEKSEQPKSELHKGIGNVLLVDDEEIVLNTGEMILEKLGYNVITASNGSQAIEYYKKNIDSIDIVLLDMIMPGMNGGEVFDRLRKINPDAKIILSSGYSLDGDAKEIMDRGCNGFIQKPFGIVDLSKKIMSTL